jgi:hypothetical protein
MAPTLAHLSLHAILKGTTSAQNGTTVAHYRGIPYGRIPRRFTKAELIESWSDETLDCTHFG